MAIRSFYNRCKRTQSSFLSIVFRALLIKVFFNKKIVAHQKTILRGIRNIHCPGILDAGIGYVNFMHRKDVTYLNIQGKLKIQGDYSIGRGCRLDIDRNALVEIGKGGYINANTKLIIVHSLTIGDGCTISWDCQFLDEDFHKIEYPGKKVREKGIVLGDHVWIGSGVCIFSGAKIAKGSVVAANSSVHHVFEEENVLIAGNPARIVKRNIHWTV